MFQIRRYLWLILIIEAKMNSLEITVHLRSEQTILQSPSLEITGRSGTDRVASKQELKLQWQYVDLRTTHGLIYHATSSLYVLQRSFRNLEESLQLFFVFSLSIIFFFIRDTSFEMLEILESGNQPGSIVFRGGSLRSFQRKLFLIFSFTT